MFYIKKFTVFFIILITSLNINNVTVAAENTVISDLLTKYLQFQNSLGKSTSRSYTKEIKELFLPEIVYIDNGQIFAKGFDQLEKRFMELKEMYGNWGAVLQKATISSDQATATIQYELLTERAGIFHVVSILHISKEQKISMIDESYYRLDNELENE